MALDLSSLLVDSAKETSGIRFEFPNGAYLIAARPGNPQAVAENARLNKQHEQQLKFLPEAEQEKLRREIMAKLLFKTVFLDWGGFIIEGKSFEYSEENCIKLMTDSKYSRIGELFIEAVQNGEKQGDFGYLPTGAEQEEIVKK